MPSKASEIAYGLLLKSWRIGSIYISQSPLMHLLLKRRKKREKMLGERTLARELKSIFRS
jgi:hypothetical protein